MNPKTTQELWDSMRVPITDWSWSHLEPATHFKMHACDMCRWFKMPQHTSIPLNPIKPHWIPLNHRGWWLSPHWLRVWNLTNPQVQSRESAARNRGVRGFLGPRRWVNCTGEHRGLGLEVGSTVHFFFYILFLKGDQIRLEAILDRRVPGFFANKKHCDFRNHRRIWLWNHAATLQEYLGLGLTPASSQMSSYSHPNQEDSGMFTLGWGLQEYRVFGPDHALSASHPLRICQGWSLGPGSWRYLERVPYYVSSVLPNCTESKYLYVCKWRPRMVNASISLASSIQTDGFDNQASQNLMVEKFIFLLM